MKRVSVFAIVVLFLLSACTSGINSGKAIALPDGFGFIAPTPANGATIFTNQASIAVSVPANTALCSLVQDSAKSATGSGKDGALTVSQAGQIINTYISPITALASGMTSIPVRSSAGFSAGDVVLFVNVRSGINERKEVFSVAINTLNFITGLLQNYPQAETQIVRLPQFTTLTINAGASITAPAFNGATGGIVGFLANGDVTINGNIDVNSLGYAGGTGLGACRGRCPLPGGTVGQGPGGGAGSGCAGAGGGGTNSASGDQLILGSGGGGGMCVSTGGRGAGIIFAIAKSIVLNGAMTSNGQAGMPGTWSVGGAYPAGGGSGGVIHLEAETLTLGANKITALGGQGGFDGFNQRFAPSGGPGLIRLKGTVSGSTNPVASVDVFQNKISQETVMTLANEVATLSLTNLSLGLVSYGVVCNTGSTPTNTFTVVADTTVPITTSSATSNGQQYVFGGQSIAPVSLLLACADSGSGCRETKFCTNQNTTCAPNTLFAQPVIISQFGTTKFCFASIDNTGNTEATVCNDVVIVPVDTTAPTTTSSAISTGVAYVFGATANNTVISTLACADAGNPVSGCQSTLFCASPNNNCIPNLNYALGQQIVTNSAGTTKLCFASKDNANHQEVTVCKTIVIQFPVVAQDTVAPTTTPSATAFGLVYDFGSQSFGPVVASLFCADAGNPVSGCASTKFCTSFNVNCNPSTVFAGQQIIVSAVGTTKLCFRSFDNVNNAEAVVCRDIVIVAQENPQDIVAPTTSSTATTNGIPYVFGATANNTVISTLACADASNPVSGCQSTLFCTSLNNNCVPNLNYVSGQQIITNTAGTTKLCFASKDNANNQEAAVCKTIVIQFSPNLQDIVVPVTAATGTNNGVAYVYGTPAVGSVISTLACVDAGVPTSGCASTKFCTNLNTDCVPNLNYALGQQIVTNAIGTTRLCFASVDAGNNAELTKCVSIVLQAQNTAVDTVAPTTTASATVNGQMYVYSSAVIGPVVNSLFCADAGSPVSGCSVTRFCTNINNNCAPNILYSGQFISVNAVGITKLCFQSIDNAANQEALVCKDIVIVAAAQDLTPPITNASATTNGQDYLYGAQTQFSVVSTLACADGQSECASTLFCTNLNANCNPNLAYAQAQQIITSAVGTTKLCFASKDVANNHEAVKCKDIVIAASPPVGADITAPVTSANASINNSAYIFGTSVSTPVFVSLSCADVGTAANPASGCRNTVFCVNANSDCVPATLYTAQEIQINQNGTTRVCFKSSDIANNAEQKACVSVLLNVLPVPDNVLPVTNAQFLNGNLPYISGTIAQSFVSFTLNCADAGSGCKRTLMCTGQESCVPTIVMHQGIQALFNPVITQSGTTHVCFRSIDQSNNLEATKCEVVVRPNVFC